MQNKTLVAVLTIAATLLPAGLAHATIFVDGTSGDDFVMVGRTSIDNRVRWCRDSPGSAQDAWGFIGTSSSLPDNVEIRGLDGADTLRIIRISTTITGYCGGLYVGPVYNGYFIDITGGNGNDQIFSGGGNSQVTGDAGADIIRHYNQMGMALGGSGNDSIVGRGGDSETLRGQTGNDCLQDDNDASNPSPPNNYAQLDCGGDLGDSYYFGNCHECPAGTICPPFCVPGSLGCAYYTDCPGCEYAYDTSPPLNTCVGCTSSSECQSGMTCSGSGSTSRCQ